MPNLELGINCRRGWSDQVTASYREAVHSTTKTTSLVTEGKHSIFITTYIH